LRNYQRSSAAAVAASLLLAGAAPATAAVLDVDTTQLAPDDAPLPFTVQRVGGNDGIAPGTSPARPGALQTFTLATGGTFASAQVWLGGDLDPDADGDGVFVPENLTWFLYDATGFGEPSGVGALTELARGNISFPAEGNSINRLVQIDLGTSIAAAAGGVYAIGLGNGGNRLDWNVGRGNYPYGSGNVEDIAPYALGAGYIEVIDGVTWDPTDSFVVQYSSHFERPIRETGLSFPDPEFEQYDIDFNLRVFIEAGSAPVPEPTTLALLGLGAAALAARSRR